MSDPGAVARISATFPDLAGLAAEDRTRLTADLTVVTLPAGQTVFAEGSGCESFLFVLDGAVRVRKTSESGREIVLYRVEQGQTCVLTTACLLGRLPYGAEGVTETTVEAAILGRSSFDALLTASPPFRRFVFAAYADRVSDLLMLIEEVAFGRIDVRLAHCLLQRQDASGVITGTHYDLAVELGTAREVISRQLKEFERRGWVETARGRITLHDPDALTSLK